jgi:LAGLIDADG endonuclease
MNRTSKEILTESIERRMKHMMVQLLNQFDERFPDLVDGQQGRLFKFDIKNQFNDAIRATRDEIRDYDVEYRPVRFNPDNTLSVTKAFMEGIQSITFLDPHIEVKTGFCMPGMRIVARTDPQHMRVLEAIRRELGGGIVYKDQAGVYNFDIRGLDHCINSVIPFMDLYKLCSSVQNEYTVWRRKVVQQYTTDPHA